MPSDSYSFLDVAILDAVRARFAAGDALVILSIDLEQVIWANGAGAALLGYDDIEAVLGASSGLGAPARRQISATSGFPAIGRDRPLLVRLAVGVTSRAIAMLATELSLPDGEPAILLASPNEVSGARSDMESASRVIGGFSEAGHFVGLIDGQGGIMAASPGFAALGISTESLTGLVQRAGTSRIAKRMIEGTRGPLPAGLARLTDDPARHLLVVVDESRIGAPASEADSAQPEAPDVAEVEGAAELRASGITVAGATGSGGIAEISPLLEETPAKDPAQSGHDTWYFSSGDDGTTDEAEAELDDAVGAPDATEPSGPDIALPLASGENEARSDREHPELETVPEKAVGELDPDSASPAEASPAKASVRPAIDRQSAPIRFVWRTDAQGQFSQISPEFAAAVGDDPANIVGRRFEDVAAALGFDTNGEIAGLLDRRDTWSGRSVLWPVAGASLRIPVDLAALPVYGRDRNFEGFRGFGVARTADAIPGEARALPALTESSATPERDLQPQSPSPGDEAEAAKTADPFRGEVPALEIAPMPDRRFSDKVIRLAEHRQPANDKGLSTGERVAFQQIAERLKRESAPPAEKIADRPAEKLDTDAPAKTPGYGAGPAAEDTQGAATQGDAVGDRADRPIEAVRDEASAETAAEFDQTAEPAVPDVAESVSTSAEAGPDEASAADMEEPLAIPVERPGPAEPARPRKRSRPGMSLLDFAQWDREDAPEATGEAADDIDAGPAMIADDDETAAHVVPDEIAVASHAEAAADDGQADAETLPAAEPEIEVGTEPSVADASPLPIEQTTPPAPSPPDREAGRDTAILEKLPVPVLVHSGDVLHYANDEFLALTGYESVEQLVGAGGIGALFAEDYEDEGQPDRRDRQLRLITAQGEEFPVDAFLQSVAWNGGKALLLVLRRAVDGGFGAAGQSPLIAELEARVAEMRTIIDTATDGVVLMTNDGTIRSISRPAEALFSFDSDEVAGKAFESLFAIESQRSARDYLTGLSDNGVASVLNDGREVIGRESRGRFIPLFMTIGRLPNDSGYCAVVRDITQWKRAEEDLTQARAVAERASSQKTDFLARVSHEIRTPLNAIIGFSELMVDERFGPVTNDRYRDYLRDINRSGNHVLDLVNDLLDISKIEAGQQEMDYEAVSLNDALAETVAMMQPQANRERVIIRSSFASKLPDVVADLRSVRQIALNILSNAVRYTQAGGQVIVSTAYESAGDIVMRVRDTGIGMTQAEIEQAMKPFKQINSLKRARGDGTGLGLPLTKAMVEANRAKFVIHSTPGEGTLVEVTFPSTRVLAD